MASAFSEWQTVTPRRKRASQSFQSNSPSPQTQSQQPLKAKTLQFLNSPFHALTFLDETPKASKLQPKAAVTSQKKRNGNQENFVSSPASNSPMVKSSEGIDKLQKCFDVAISQNILNEFKARFPNRPEVHLQALVENIEMNMSQFLYQVKPFHSKSFSLNQEWLNGFYSQVPENYKKFLLEELKEYPNEALQAHFIHCCQKLIEIQKKCNGKSIQQNSLGFQVFIQFLLKQFRNCLNLNEAIDLILKDHFQFQANPAVGHTFLWIISQPKPQSSDFLIWLNYCLPAFGDQITTSSASFQSLSLDYANRMMERLTQTSAPVPVQSDYLGQIISFVYDDNHVIVQHKKGSTLINQMKNIYCHLKASLNLKNPIFEFEDVTLLQQLLSLQMSKSKSLKYEVYDLFLLLLQKDFKLFDSWLTIFPNYPAETTSMLFYFNENWHLVRSFIHQQAFQQFLSGLTREVKQLQNPTNKTQQLQLAKLLKNGFNRKSFIELEQTVYDLQQKTNGSSLLGFLFKTVTFFLIIFFTFQFFCPPGNKVCHVVQARLMSYLSLAEGKLLELVEQNPQLSTFYHEVINGLNDFWIVTAPLWRLFESRLMILVGFIQNLIEQLQRQLQQQSK